MKHLLLLAFALLQALVVAAIFRAQLRRGVYGDFIARWRRMKLVVRILVIVLVSSAGAYAANKLFGNRIHEILSAVPQTVATLCTNMFNAAERLTGYAVSMVRTNEVHDLSMPEGARLAERIARRGAHDDGFWLFAACTNRLAREGLEVENPVWIHTDGTVTVRSPAPGVPIEELSLYTTYSNIVVYAPLQGSYGFLPGSKWPDFCVSRIWTAETDRGTRVVTWEGAMKDRDPAQPVSFQAEFSPDGKVTYRYDTFPTNGVATGVFRNGAALAFNTSGTQQDFQDFLGFQDIPGLSTLHPFNLSTLVLSYIGDLGDGSGDTDNDGLTDWEEVKRYNTDPREENTDGDGLLDGYEVQNGTDPLNPDTDGNGMPDGWSQEQYDNHRFFNGQEGDRTITITLQAPTPASNRAVLRMGDMPILLCETNLWTFSIPTGTVWNVELRTDGLPVQLALEAGAGIFAENADDVFASCQLEEELQAPLRSAPASPQPPSGGSRGGSAKLYAPCIFLEPSMQVVHTNESVTVWARCIPDTPPLSGKLTWSFEPDYMAVHVIVASDKMSATVSGMDDEWHSSVTLHANAGDSLTTQAMIHYCNGRDNCPTNYVSFSPNHTNATINPVFRHCDHPFYDDLDAPKVFLEVEVGRDTATGWQRLAWVATDSETPGLQQRTAISRDNPPTINWDAKATSSAPLADGTDSLVYDSHTTFARALPAVSAGQYVPPPFATIKSRIFDDKNNLVAEFSTTQSIPQYVKITWDSAVLDEFRQPIVYNYIGATTLPPTNVTLFAGCSAAETSVAFAAIPARVKNMLPANVNIVFVGADAEVPQPHKTVNIQPGMYFDTSIGAYRLYFGLTPREHCRQRNDSPLGMAYVFDGQIRKSISDEYGDFYVNENINANNDWRNVPLPLSKDSLVEFIAQEVLHECCHSMGLVPTASTSDGDHNDCECGSHYMDAGDTKTVLKRLGFIVYYVQGWMQKNEKYLRFVLPLAH